MRTNDLILFTYEAWENTTWTKQHSLEAFVPKSTTAWQNGIVEFSATGAEIQHGISIFVVYVYYVRYYMTNSTSATTSRMALPLSQAIEVCSCSKWISLVLSVN